MEILARVIFTIAFCILSTGTACACEPILPTTVLLYGNLATTAFLVRVWWAMILVVALKIALFWWFAPQIPRIRGAIGVVVGNVISTLLGIVFVFFQGTSGFGVEIFPFSSILVDIVAVYFISLASFRRIERLRGPELQWLPGASRSAELASAAMFFTFFLFLVVTGLTPNHDSGWIAIAIYWLLKWMMVTIALLVGLPLTTVWEEWGMSLVLRRTETDRLMVERIFRINAIALGVFLLWAAILTLPERWRTPGFLMPRRHPFEPR